MTLTPNGETLSFISIHKTDDVRQLALKSRPDGVDMAYALEQIAGWQTARRKLPTWADTAASIHGKMFVGAYCRIQAAPG